MNLQDAQTIRTALSRMPKAGSASIGSPPLPDEMYVLPSHGAAIDPDVSLVIGNRGMGKTFWAAALFDPKMREIASKAFPNARGDALQHTNVLFGFADREGVQGVSSDEILRHSDVESEVIWRGLLLHLFTREEILPLTFAEGVSLALNYPDKARARFREHDQRLQSSGQKDLIMFDQLDQLAGNWPQIQNLTKGLLRTALAMKSYRSIRLKIFMRTDQAADENLFSFADASKIWGEAARLRWYSSDLYGLVYSWLWRDDKAQIVIKQLMHQSGRGDFTPSVNAAIPVSLAAEPTLQGTLFDQIAGDKMGGGAKRGRPYSWIPAHLADAMNEISPRSFITALSVAADRIPETTREHAIDFKRIQEGVRSASDHRRRELSEDYPWINEALTPLSGMTVPAERREIQTRWKSLDVPQKILNHNKNTKAPIEVVTAPADEKSRLEALVRALEQIGVFEERVDARVNIPDIFRIAAGVKRRGGITPQQRRRI